MNTPLSNIPSTEFEIHFAAETGGIPLSLPKRLEALDFRDDHMVGEGVVFSPNDPIGKISCPLTGLHMTWDTFDRKAFVDRRQAFDALLDEFQQDTTGYAHCEVIKPEWDFEIPGKKFDPTIPFPLHPFESAYSTRPKQWDIHISADRLQLDAQLEERLFNHARMYFIDLKKRSGKVHRVFTIQGSNPTLDGLRVFGLLTDYLLTAGGMAGSIKFEDTCYWREVGKTGLVPPTIEHYSQVANGAATTRDEHPESTGT